MTPVKANRLYGEPETLYKKANTKSQRALLGYMAKFGFLRDPIYIGAFRLLSEIESSVGVYSLSTDEKPKIAMEIVRVAESAMLGMWDNFAFSEREIKIISQQFGNFQSLGGK